MAIIGIAASTKDGIIAVNGKIPWRYKEDFAFFKFMTTGHTIIMGGKTFRDIGKPLPNRKNVVISRTPPEVSQNPDLEFISINNSNPIKDIEKYLFEDEDVYICGGGEIYEMFAPFIDKWIVTIISDEINHTDSDKVTKLNISAIESTYRSIAEMKLSEKCKVVKFVRPL